MARLVGRRKFRSRVVNFTKSRSTKIKKELLYKAINILNEREKKIIRRRRMTENPKTLEDLSKVYKIVVEREDGK